MVTPSGSGFWVPCWRASVRGPRRLVDVLSEHLGRDVLPDRLPDELRCLCNGGFVRGRGETDGYVPDSVDWVSVHDCAVSAKVLEQSGGDVFVVLVIR